MGTNRWKPEQPRQDWDVHRVVSPLFQTRGTDQRDRLTRAAQGDFGFGWNLGVTIQTEVTLGGDVTLTLNGRRRTFYFTPQPNQVFTSYYAPVYTPEPGMFGSLVNTGDNCNGVLVKAGTLFECAINNAGAVYSASGFRYTDAYGRVYTMSSTGSLQSIQDLSGNTLTITPAGISSTNGLSVPFVRDTSGLITQITDTLGNHYLYAYDTAGNLTSVTYPPAVTGQQPSQYQYDPTHLLTQETDQRGNIAGTTTNYLDGKLKSVTDTVNDDMGTTWGQLQRKRTRSARQSIFSERDRVPRYFFSTEGSRASLSPFQQAPKSEHPGGLSSCDRSSKPASARISGKVILCIHWVKIIPASSRLIERGAVCVHLLVLRYSARGL